MNKNIIEPLSEFAKLLGKELDRYGLNGDLVNSVECTEDNLINLYNTNLKIKLYMGRYTGMLCMNILLNLKFKKRYES